MTVKHFLYASLVISLFTLINCSEKREYEYGSVYQLIERTLPGQSDNFILEPLSDENFRDAFVVSSKNDKVIIQGTDNLSLCKGFYYYLRHNLNANISRNGSQIPSFEKLPSVDSLIRMGTNDKYRYYLNYCTYGYSMAFWTWEDWEQEIDWMAMQGINLPLAILGTEAVWQNTLKHFNFSDQEIADFIPGPAYTPWWLMDNLEGWGGPVSQEYIDSRAELQKKILKRMRDLGMSPILPAFYGMVPNSAISKFPKNHIEKDVKWGGLQRPAFLDPSDSLFTEMASVFYTEQEKLYGKSGYYSGDPFHEGGKQMGDVTLAASKIQTAMQKHSPNSTWVLMAWHENPTDDLLLGTKVDQTLILDLHGENSPMYEKRGLFGNRNFIWCNVNNFGNNTYMFANFDSISQVPLKLRTEKYSKSSNGIGLCIEGNYTDPIVYDLFYDMPWEPTSFNLDQWIEEYSTYRFGSENDKTKKAFQILGETVYKAPHRTENVLCARPSITAKHVTTWGPTSELQVYSQDSLMEAVRLMLEVSDESVIQTETYKFDIANMCRQALSGIAKAKLQKVQESYETKDLKSFTKQSSDFLSLILYADSLAAFMPGYSFYAWQRDAVSIASDSVEAKLFLWNANRQVSLWANQEGSNDLHDYSYREWYGLLSNFYHPRWKIYFNYLSDKLRGAKVDEPDFYKFEHEWCNKRFFAPSTQMNEIKPLIKRIFAHSAL